MYQVREREPKVGEKVHNRDGNSVVVVDDLLTIERVRTYLPVEGQWRVEVIGSDFDFIIKLADEDWQLVRTESW